MKKNEKTNLLEVIKIFNETYSKKRKIILVLLSICLIGILTINTISVASATDITIDSTTPGGVKVAVGIAKDGDTICLKDGIYKGENNTNITIKKNITINGLGSKVVIDGEAKKQIMVINKTNVKVSVNNLKFTNGRAMEEIYDESSGGAILSQGTLIVNNCTFTNNKASYAGAIYSQGKCTIKNTKFVNNSANAYGGAIQTLGKLTISNCTFKDNQAKGGIGAIYSMGTLTMSSSTFTNNKGKDGGAINSYGNLSVNKCIFKNNYYEAIDASGKSIVKSSTFKNNNALHGGAISADGNLILKSCKFTKNTAKYYGGAIYTNIILNEFSSNPGKLTVDKCTFNNNKAGEKGGAIFNVDFKKIKITDSKFIKNIAGKKYNAIYSPKKIKITKKNVFISPKDGFKVKTTKK